MCQVQLSLAETQVNSTTKCVSGAAVSGRDTGELRHPVCVMYSCLGERKKESHSGSVTKAILLVVYMYTYNYGWRKGKRKR